MTNPNIAANGYTIYFSDSGYEALNRHLSETAPSSIFVITDTGAHEYCLQHFLQRIESDIPIEIIEFEAGESSKNIETCTHIWTALTELGADRKSIIINLGGGVASDLGGFAASTFKRGIDFINVPTTLLAMVDASIGGKNGIDLGNLKNQVGTITVPKLLVIDTKFLETLPQTEMRSGLAEMLKHGLIRDKIYWNQFLDLNHLDLADLDALIYRSVEIKNEIVLEDPTENGVRKALNFGHTLGHAIESFFMESSELQTLLHGEAIAAGMVLEAFLSVAKGLITVDEYAQVKSLITTIFGRIDFARSDIDNILELLIHDKKNESGKVMFALIDGIGNIRIDQQAENAMILQAFEDYKT